MPQLHSGQASQTGLIELLRTTGADAGDHVVPDAAVYLATYGSQIFGVTVP